MSPDPEGGRHNNNNNNYNNNNNNYNINDNNKTNNFHGISHKVVRIFSS